jgi:hypothetical protein
VLGGEEVRAVDRVQDYHQSHLIVLCEYDLILVEHIPNGDLAEVAHVAQVDEHRSEVTIYLLLSHRGQVGLDAEGVVLRQLFPLDLVEQGDL